MSVHSINPHDFSRPGTYSPRSVSPGYMSATLKVIRTRGRAWILALPIKAALRP